MSSHTTEKVIFIETKIIKLLKEEMYFFLWTLRNTQMQNTGFINSKAGDP
jgi:hypothetical protein